MSSLIPDSMEQILDRFDEAWNGPTPPRIEDYLAAGNPDQRLALLIELVRIDLERRLAAGEKVRLEEAYLRRFPELSADRPAVAALAKQEFDLRRRNEPDLTPAEYVERFPQCQTELLAYLSTLSESRGPEQEQQTAEFPLTVAATELDLRGYELMEALGKGGMGEVYRCGDPALGRDLAIKVIKAAHRIYPEVERRFFREARVTASLQHPGIVPVHNLGRLADGRLHYTMRLVRGRTLAAILKEEAGKPERLPSLLSIFEKICQAVAYAHSKQVIHRDLKPANVMVGRFGEVQVMDWGLAKLLTAEDELAAAEGVVEKEGTRIFTEGADTPLAETRLGREMGTPAYMSPEQALGEWDMVDERADVFALGSILCEILTGKPAYRGTESSEVYRRAKRGDITEALESLQQCGADAALTALCRECLSPHRDERPRDAAVVANRVAAYQAEVQDRLRQAELERARALVKATEERKRRRLTLVLASVVLLAILAGGGAFLLVQRQKQARQEQTTRLVQQALGQATALREQARAVPMENVVQRERAAALWRDTLAAAERAEQALAGGDAEGDTSNQARELLAELREQAADTDKDRRMLEQLEQAHDLEMEIQESDYARKRRVEEFVFGLAAVPAYAAAFRDYGIDVEALSPAEAAERIRQRPIRFQLAVALDDWYFLAPEAARGKLLEISGAADPDPLRGRVRGAIARKDRQALKQLADSKEAIDLPVPTLILLADVVHEQGLRNEGMQLLKRARSRYPDDFWVNDVLGLHLEFADPPDCGGAARCFASAIAIRPNNPLGWSNLGTMLLVLGRLDEAVAVLREAVRIRPDFLMSYQQLAIALITREEFDEALAMLKEALRRHPDSPMLRTTVGQILQIEGKHDEAITTFRKVLARHPEWVAAQTALALALSAKGADGEALELLDQTQRAHAENSDIFDTRGAVLLRKGDLEGALTSYRKATELGSSNVFVWGHLAEVLTVSGRANEALQIHRKAIHVAPENAAVHVSLADSLRFMGRTNEAEAECRLAIQLNSRSAPAHYTLGLVLLSQGKFKDAEHAFRQTLSFRPREPWYHAYLGNSLRSQKDYPGARAALGEAIRLKPDEGAFHASFGQILYDQGRYREVIPHYQAAVRLQEAKFGLGHPITLTSRNDLANAYLMAGSIAEAIRLHEQTLKQREAKLGPDHPDTLLSMANLGVASRDVGKPKEAIPLLETALQRGRQQPGGLPASLGWLSGALAETYERDGQFAKAESIYRDSLGYSHWQFGPDDLRTASALAQLCNNLLKQKKYAEAEPHLRDCLKVREAKLPGEWTTFNARSLLGEALLGQKKYTAAEPLLVQGYEGMKQRQDKIPLLVRQLRLSEALERLMRLYEATEQKEKAADWRKKLEETRAAQKKSKP